MALATSGNEFHAEIQNQYIHSHSLLSTMTQVQVPYQLYKYRCEQRVVLVQNRNRYGRGL